MSSLSFDDTVRIVAQFNASHLSSKESPEALLNRGYSQDAIKHMMKQVESEFQPIVSCGLRFKKPFQTITYPYFIYVLEAFRLYKLGTLPDNGSLFDQPGQIMDIFSLLSNLFFEKEQREIKQAQRKHSKGKLPTPKRTR